MRSPPMILVVEDNRAAREILEARLAASGYEVLTAKDGRTGLQLARERRPDLILLDIMMPKMDGIEVCRRLKTDATLPFIPVIMLTAKAEAEDIVAGLEAGSDEYLTKPVNQAALVARVKSMLRIKALQDTVAAQAAQLETQLKTAAKIQTLFWPQMPKLGSGAHIWATSRPAGYLGGDLFDVMTLPDESVLSYVADIAGKGVAAALLMAALATQIRIAAPQDGTLDRLLTTVNRTFYDLVAEEGFFATLVLVRFWPDQGRLHIASAGHPAPVRVVDGIARKLPIPGGTALGATPDGHYAVTEHHLSPGESLLVFSDGVVEAENARKARFGYPKVLNRIREAQGPPWGQGLLRAVGRWRGASPINDDITILEIWCEPGEKAHGKG